MEDITLEINGIAVKASPQMTLLQSARKAGIEIPTLCYNEKLTPYGGCRLCLVEIKRNNRTRLVASCVYPVEEGLVVKTETENLKKIRRLLLELILPLSPTGPVLALAEKYGLKGSRFKAEETQCMLCGLCVRHCAEIKKANAIGFVDRGINRKVAFIPEVASRICANCRTCVELCPSGKVASCTDGGIFPALPWEAQS
jgi:bidirectional [NiFe] hydrogenase diaphorase subunit